MEIKRKRRKIDFKYNMDIYIKFLMKYKLILGAILFMIIIMEATVVAENFLFKIIVDDGASFAAETMTQAAFISSLAAVGTIFVSMILIKGIGGWIRAHLTNKIETYLILDIKRKYFNHLVHLSHEFHSTHKTGSLISRLVRGKGAMESMTDAIIFNFAPFIFYLLITAASVAQFGIAYSLITLGVSAAFILFTYKTLKIQEPASVNANDTEDYEKAIISDIFTNIDSIQYFGKEDAIKKRYKKLSQETGNALKKFWNYFRWIESGQELIIGAGTLLLLYFSLTSFIAGEITIGTLVFIYTVYGTLVGILYRFIFGLRSFYRAMADFQPLFNYGRIKNEIKDNKGAKDLKIKRGEIKFMNVSFAYKRRKIFSKFSLKIRENEKVAIVGPSGSGKTTLIKLLYRLYDVNEGSILIDGKDIKDFKQETLRSELSIVPQDCVLFDDTIYSNVAFSNPKANRDEVIKAMKFAQLYKIVNNFPKKEKTVVGERGVKLSGGEKQRVSIARAILADKKVLVLDEATSSLDSQTEKDIQKDLKMLMKGRTSIIIAHRLSTIMSADKIIVMDNGKIAQMGSHEKLIKQKGLYRKLWNLQKGGYIK